MMTAGVDAGRPGESALATETGRPSAGHGQAHEHELVRPIRKLCMAFPTTQERVSHGEPAWFVGGKRMFLMFADHHHDDRIAFWAAAQDGVQRHLLEDEPSAFFSPAYVGPRGWIGMWLDRPGLDWDRVELLVDEAWRCIAGPRLVKAYDTQR